MPSCAFLCLPVPSFAFLCLSVFPDVFLNLSVFSDVFMCLSVFLMFSVFYVFSDVVYLCLSGLAWVSLGWSLPVIVDLGWSGLVCVDLGWPGLVPVSLGWSGLVWVCLCCSATFCFPDAFLCSSMLPRHHSVFVNIVLHCPAS